MQFVDKVIASRNSYNDLTRLTIEAALYHPVFLLMMGLLFAFCEIISQIYGVGISS